MNSRFSVAIHILTLLAMNPDEHITSEYLSKSVNTNPVVIRRITGQMKKAGIVDVKPGVGGAVLLKNAEDITLFEVFRAVNTEKSMTLFPLHENPSSSCYVGKNIHDALEMPLVKAEQALRNGLSTTCISDICAFIQARRDRGPISIFYSE